MTQKHRSISLIVIHCSATRVTQDFTFEQLEACHLARGLPNVHKDCPSFDVKRWLKLVDFHI